MVRTRRERKDGGASEIKLRQPDRSGPDPSKRTLLDLAQDRDLFKQADDRERELRKAKHGQGGKTQEEEDDEELLPPYVQRIMDTLLWTVSLSMLHFTLDVLVQHQYAVDINWFSIAARAGQAFLVFVLLFYTLHPWESSPSFVPGIPLRYQHGLRQAIFLVTSVAAGCYLIHTTNNHGYMAVMKRAPPVGCLWVWSVIELDLALSVVSVASTGAFVWWGGYKIT